MHVREGEHASTRPGAGGISRENSRERQKLRAPARGSALSLGFCEWKWKWPGRCDGKKGQSRVRYTAPRPGLDVRTWLTDYLRAALVRSDSLKLHYTHFYSQHLFSFYAFRFSLSS